MAEVQHSLSRGVARADDQHVVTPALHRLAAAGAVVDAAPEQLIHAVDLEAAPVHARRDERDAARELVAPVDLDAKALGQDVSRDDAAEHELRSEALRLAAGAARELGTAHALGKAEEVLDQRSVRSLAARQVAFEHDGREPVRRGVDGGRQPGRPGAHDRDVVLGSGRAEFACSTRPGAARP